MIQDYIGYLEHASPALLGLPTENAGKGGYTIFAQMLGCFQGMPWCAVFVHAMYREQFGREQAERMLGKPQAGVRQLARRMKLSGRWRGRDYTPKPWDIVFCSDRSDHRLTHCGIVERLEDRTVISIEGNTVDPSGVFQPEQGGAVARRCRETDDVRIIGYAAIYSFA